MAVLHTWLCAAHGEFQSFKSKCSSGCGASMVTKVLGCSISTGVSKAKANMVDRKMNDIARQFGVTDLNIRAGKSATPDEFRWSDSHEIQRKRMAGETYSVPIDHPPDNINSVIGVAGTSSDGNILNTMKDAGSLKFDYHVDPKLSDYTKI